MTEAQPQSVLRKKARAGRRGPDNFAVTPEKAMVQALARAAQELLSLPLRVRETTESRMTLADLPEALEERALLALLHGPRGAMGLMMLCPALMAALIEMRTTGRLGSGAPSARRPTRTDAAMAADFVDATLAAIEEMLAGDPALVWAGGFRYASFLDDPRPLPLVLEDQPYRVFCLTVEMGASAAARAGPLLLVLPAEGRGLDFTSNLKAPEPRPSAAAEAAAAQLWSDRLELAVMAAPGRLEAVLARLHLPLGRILALQPGMALTLPTDSLATLRLEGPGGRVLARARLGQHQGRRAVRLCGTEEGEECEMPGPVAAGLTRMVDAASPAEDPGGRGPAFGLASAAAQTAAPPDPEAAMGAMPMTPPLGSQAPLGGPAIWPRPAAAGDDAVEAGGESAWAFDAPGADDAAASGGTGDADAFPDLAPDLPPLAAPLSRIGKG